jgi:hypothetical protein
VAGVIAEFEKPWESPSILLYVGVHAKYGRYFHPFQMIYNLLPSYVVFGGYVGYDAILMSVCSAVTQDINTSHGNCRKLI